MPGENLGVGCSFQIKCSRLLGSFLTGVDTAATSSWLFNMAFVIFVTCQGGDATFFVLRRRQFSGLTNLGSSLIALSTKAWNIASSWLPIFAIPSRLLAVFWAVLKPLVILWTPTIACLTIAWLTVTVHLSCIRCSSSAAFFSDTTWFVRARRLLFRSERS